jgi:hypothetical protein
VTLAGCHALYQQISGRFDAAVIPDHVNVEGGLPAPASHLGDRDRQEPAPLKTLVAAKLCIDLRGTALTSRTPVVNDG